MILFYIPVDNGEDARTIARTLLRERLVACANLIPMRSLYAWEGEIREEDEVCMILKTRDELAPDVERRVAELHSYEIPCIAAFEPHSLNAAYEAWVRRETEHFES